MLMYPKSKVYAYEISSVIGLTRLEKAYPGLDESKSMLDEIPMIYVVINHTRIEKYELSEASFVKSKYGCEIWEL